MKRHAPFIPFFVDAYLADTIHLNTEEHGAYMLLLINMWRGGYKPLPDDKKIFCKITGLSDYKWQRVREKLEPFFLIADGHWRHKRMERDWDNVKKRINNKTSSNINMDALRKQRERHSIFI